VEGEYVNAIHLEGDKAVTKTEIMEKRKSGGQHTHKCSVFIQRF
jgi:hypothetical protein